MDIKNGSISCDICGTKGAKVRYVSRSYGHGERLLVIENVPVISCPQCGESYLTAQTLRGIERIKQGREMVRPRSVPVATFA